MLRDFYLEIGEVLVIDKGRIALSLPDASACICLFSKEYGIGGVAFYERASMGKYFHEKDALKYGEVAFETLIDEIATLKGEEVLDKLKAKIIGGNSQNMANIILARSLLRRYKIALVTEKICEKDQKKILFSIPDGKLKLETPQKSIWRSLGL